MAQKPVSLFKQVETLIPGTATSTPTVALTITSTETTLRSAGGLLDTDAADLNILAGASSGTGTVSDGGDIFITSGDSAVDRGGNMELFTGNATLDNGGEFILTTGDGVRGGDITLDCGVGITDNGGNISISAGPGGTPIGGGGNVVIQSGGSSGTDNPGDIRLLGGSTIVAGIAAGNIELETGNSGAGGAAGILELKSIETHIVNKDAAIGGELKYLEATSNGTDYVSLNVPASITTTRTWTLPVDDPAVVAGRALTTDASGVLSYTDSPQVFQLQDADSDTIIRTETSSGSDDDIIEMLLPISGDFDAVTALFLSSGGIVINSANVVAASGEDGPPIDILAGEGEGDGGSITIQGGNTIGGGSGGQVEIRGGTNTVAGSGGGVNLSAGGAIGGGEDAGGISLTAGVATGGATVGRIQWSSDDAHAGGLTSSVAGHLRFREAQTNGSNWVTLTSPLSVTTDRTWTLPVDDPTVVDGLALTTDATGILSFGGGVINANLFTPGDASPVTAPTGYVKFTVPGTTQEFVMQWGSTAFAGGTGLVTPVLLPLAMTSIVSIQITTSATIADNSGWSHDILSGASFAIRRLTTTNAVDANWQVIGII